MPLTSRFGWTTPADTDAISAGAGVIRNLANAIDSAMAAFLSSTTGTRPPAGTLGRFHYSTDDHDLVFDSGTAWHQVVGAGDLKPTARSTAPPGWLLCDGTPVSRSTYGALFDAIGTTYGAGDGSTTFNLPDLRGRVPVGVDGAAARLSANDALGNTGGEERHVLSLAELAPHSHGPLTSGQRFLTWKGTFGGTDTATHNIADGLGLDESFSTANAGSGTAHNNMQPYAVVNWLVKT